MTAETSPSLYDQRARLLRLIFAATQSVTNPQVQTDFRLVPPNLNVTPPMEEFVSDNTGRRHIAMLSDSEIAARHTRLLEARVPVFSAMYMPEGMLVLQVPSGSRPITRYANSIRRNPVAYAELFREIGTALAGIEAEYGQNLTPSADYPLLRQFAAVRNDEVPSGGTIYLLPPYNLGDTSRADTLGGIRQELLETQVVLKDQADFLVAQVSEGWASH